MSKYEALHTRVGEMMELIDCHAIANGAEMKESSEAMGFMEMMNLR